MFRDALDCAPHALCMFDAVGQVIFANRGFAEIYALPAPADLVGLTIEEIVALQAARSAAPKDREAWLAQTRRVATLNESATCEIALEDGRFIHVSDHPAPGGGWVSSHIDLTKTASGDALAVRRLSLQALIDLVPDNLWVKDVESQFVIANDATARQIGLASARELIGKSDLDLHPEENARKYLAVERQVLETGRAQQDFEEFVANDGRGVWVSSTKLPLLDRDGRIIGLIGVSRDITARKLAERFRDDQAAILERIAVGAPIGETLEQLAAMLEAQIAGVRAVIGLLGESGRMRLCGGAASLPFALARAAETPLSETIAVSEIATDPEWARWRERAGLESFAVCWTLSIASPRGERVGGVELFGREARGPDEAETRILEIVRRLAGIAIERNSAEDRIRFMATHDPLTGLPSRALLQDRVAQATMIADRLGQWAVAAYVDLDNFKYVNDSFGHPAGDELLRTASSRIKALLRPADSVIRVGGDEFVIVLGPCEKDFDQIRSTLDAVQTALAEPIRLGGGELRITSSIGAACYPLDAADADTLLARADAAMYHAKESGRDNLQFYRPALDLRSNEKLLLLEELRGAIRRQEFCLHYQPQIDLATGAVLAVEALIRWRHPARGLLAPSTFIPAAEETGMIVAIGEWVIREACRQNRAWQDAGLPAIRMCVNVSARQFRDNRLVETVRSALADTGLAPEHLELELTESLIMHDSRHAVAVMQELKRIGVQMAIDDFGAGYSNLSALKIFPVARLKIDKSFVVGVPNDPSDAGVTRAVIALARQLNLRVIAEGVETAEQADFLRAQHCDEVQGFHYSRPVTAAEFADLLASRPHYAG